MAYPAGLDPMIFAEVPLAEAEGALLAHAVTVGARRIPKGTPVTPALLAELSTAGVSRLWIARPEPCDVGEADAAARLGAALAGPGVAARPPVHGRTNLEAVHPGLLLMEGIEPANAAAEEVGIATLPPFSPVNAGDLVASVKVIPFALPAAVLDRVLDFRPRLEVRPWRAGLKARILVTRLEGAESKGKDKAIDVTTARLAALGVAATVEAGIPHAPSPLARALSRADEPLVLVAGATATADRRDVIPAAIEAAGGRVERVGMPVDPGNLLVLGRRGETMVIGLPGCARSPKRNGLDLVLERWAAGLEVRSADVAGMGVGGLLEGSGAAVPWGWR
ncbi:molybdopterin biosynthesis enzyme [Thermaurantiacus sp.]|uniref:molybdopterin biosynthesis enzyme n=1 Tax=Thermaurantiacus sp. TaxID=2820283 RepID=UPI00298F0957|nr:molybdopterin biosynthesis enzyme [Thermaurantiacus sp.]